MLTVERQADIYAYISLKGSVSIHELAQKYRVSDQTIRRDLRQLEQKGQVIITFGGAYIPEMEFPNYNVNIQVRRSLAMLEKKAIALLTLPLFNDNDFVYFDHSTTMISVAELIAQQADYPHHFTVVTNSYVIAQILQNQPTIRVILLGGNVDSTNGCTSGPDTYQALHRYHFSKSFLSCSSLSLEQGITDSNLEMKTIRETALHQSVERYLLVDHTKFNSASSFQLCSIQDLHGIITDSPVPPEWEKYLAEHNIQLLTSPNFPEQKREIENGARS
ncbi:MAG: DeoR/GlpR family DNA-binding transcription regulator [Ndongobacter sp.]|nr:DeoR/GlpR family DNA-binding transcription regulator [Ndongobacter sp.]